MIIKQNLLNLIQHSFQNHKFSPKHLPNLFECTAPKKRRHQSTIKSWLTKLGYPINGEVDVGRSLQGAEIKRGVELKVRTTQIRTDFRQMLIPRI